MGKASTVSPASARAVPRCRMPECPPSLSDAPMRGVRRGFRRWCALRARVIRCARRLRGRGGVATGAVTSPATAGVTRYSLASLATCEHQPKTNGSPAGRWRRSPHGWSLRRLARSVALSLAREATVPHLECARRITLGDTHHEEGIEDLAEAADDLSKETVKCMMPVQSNIRAGAVPVSTGETPLVREARLTHT